MNAAVVTLASISNVRTDVELYRGWAEGDRDAGAKLIDRHLGSVTRFFANKAPSRIDVEDLVASTFERCAKGLGGFREEGSFVGYLLSIGWHVLCDELRKRRPDEPMDSLSIAALGPSPSAVVAKKAEQRLLLAGLRAIPIEYQAALELHYFEDLNRDEAAAVLGIPAGTLASRIRRGRELLGEAVEGLAGSASELTSTLAGLDRWLDQIRAQLGLPSK